MTNNRAERLELEPRPTWADDNGSSPDEHELQHSIAISLKRIADALDSVISGSPNSIKEVNVRSIQP